jgi:hypothetical protein
MNRDDEFIAQLEDYLEDFEGVVPLPASVRSEIHARVSETPQVRAAGRLGGVIQVVSGLSTAARMGMGIAAVIAVVVLGAAALNLGTNGPRVGALPTATASPSVSPPTAEPAPSPAASAAPEFPALPPAGNVSCGPGLPVGCVAPDRYRLFSEFWPATITFELPTGWQPYVIAPDAEGVLVTNDGASLGSGWGVMFMLVGDVPRDPCDGSAGRFDRAETETVDGLVSAMQSWPGFEASAPTPIGIDGYNGAVVELTSTRTMADCPAGTVWTTANGVVVDAYPMVGMAGQPRPGQFRILDVEGTVVVIRTTDFADLSPFELEQGLEPDPARHVADQAALAAILDSIRITP